MDNRIRLPGPKINFADDVGVTGQDHDDYPEPGQARYDHLRMYLIGLLSNQSGPQPPTQYRDGTVWFDTSGPKGVLKIRDRSEWRHLAEAIQLAPDVTLADWFQSQSS